MSRGSSPLLRGAGSILALTGGLTLAAHPGFTAPRARLQAPRPVLPGKAQAKPPLPKVLPKLPPIAPPDPAKPAVPPPGNQIMSVSEVKPGMKGYGLTVFRGTTIERFEVEVVGVLPKANVGQPLVLVKLSGGPITKRGAFLIQGMSGSPIYVNGKLLGAFSMGDAWPKDALGMVTPIEDMLEALDPKLGETPAGSEAFDFSAPAPVVADAAVPGAPFLAPDGRSVVAAGQRFRPLALPVAVSGLSARNVDRVAKILAPYNLAVMQGPGSIPTPFKAELTPGAGIGVALVTGDVDISGIGTVTYRRGNEVLAFGHPMLGEAGIGAANFPITTAWIHDVFAGFQISHKIGSAGEIVGTLTQDRPFSIAGRIGPGPKMIPVHYKVTDQTTGRSRDFNVQTVAHPLLVGQLLPVAVNQGIFAVRPTPGDAVANVKMTVKTVGAGTVTRENVVFDPQSVDLAAVRELQELMTVLGSNSFRRVPVESVDMEIRLESKRPTATVERIFVSQDRFEPGDEVEVGVVLRPYRKEPIVTKTRLRIPESATDGRAVLMVQGGATRLNLNSMLTSGAPGMLPPTGPPPDASLKQVLKRFTDRERNDQLVTRAIFPSSAVNIGGERLGQLPSTIVDIMRSTKATGFRVERDETKSIQNTEYVVDGVQTLAITIAKADHQEKPKGATSPATGISTGIGVSSGGTSGLSNLSAGDDELEDMSVFRFSVDGKPRAIRLTPEEDEDVEIEVESPKESPKEPKEGPKESPKESKETPKEKPRNNRTRDSRNGKSGRDGKTPVATTKAEDEDDDTPPASPADDKLVGRAATLWSQTSQTDFERGTLVNTAVSTSGEVRLTPGLQLAHESSEMFVWSVLGLNGATYAGTGNGGLVLKVGADGKAETFFRTGELGVHALAKDAAGNLYAGTSPNGKVFKITPDGKGTELLSLNGTEVASDAGSKFVLALAAAPDGTLYAGTGPRGKIYRIRPGAAAQELASVPDPSVVSLLLTGDGTLYAGTAEGGSIYRMKTDGDSASPAIVYDTNQAAVTGLARDAAGNLYAACAPSGEIYKIEPDGTPRVHFNKSKGALYGLLIDGSGNLYSAGANSALRIEPDGTATFLSDPKKAQFTSLAWDDQGRIVLGSANVGSVYRLTSAARGTFESTVHDAKLPARWGRMRYTGMLPDGGKLTLQTRSGNTPEPDATWSQWQEPTVKDGGQYVSSPSARFLQYRVLFEAGNGTPALRDLAIAYLPRNQGPKLALAAPAPGEVIKGSYTVKWSAVDPDKDTLTYEVAYSADGGKSWKPLGETTGKAPATSPSAAAGRPTRASAEEALKQFRAELDKDMSLTPQEREESFNKAKGLIDQYLRENPEGAEPEKPQAASTPKAPAPAAAPTRTPGVTRQASLTWDTKQVQDGVYLIRVLATDRASNPGEPLQDVKVSEPVIVTNTPPQLFLFERAIAVDGNKATVTGMATGRVSLRGAQYRLGTGDWTAIEPEDGIWDSALEHFRFPVTAQGSGEQKVEVKVVDVAGNVHTSSVKFKAP